MPEISKYTTTVQEGEATTKPGGVSYEVVLEEAKTTDKPNITTTAMLVEDIEKKLKVAFTGVYCHLQAKSKLKI